MLSPTATATDPSDEMFRWLRSMLDTQPVYVDDNQVWQVFSYAGVSRVLSDPAAFSSDVTAFTPPHPDIDLFRRGNIAMMDPPRHRKLRTLASRAFTPRVVAALAPRIVEITTSLLDTVAEADRFDLIATLADPLPITVIAELLGVSPLDRPQFHSWVGTLLSQPLDEAIMPTEELVNTNAPIIREMNEYMLDQIRQRRRQPTEDLIGKLTSVEVGSERLADEDIVGFAGVILLAGYINTTALVGNAVLSFDRYPAAAAAVRADRSLLPAALEEVLRYRPPSPRQHRITTTDTEIAGRAVPAGQLVIPWLAAANRDATRFPEPDRFDIHRDTTGHLTFGQGIHFCLGAPLARLEAKIALGILLERYPDIAVDTTDTIEFYDPRELILMKRLPVLVA